MIRMENNPKVGYRTLMQMKCATGFQVSYSMEKQSIEASLAEIWRIQIAVTVLILLK